jgi:hypothetical protein
MAYAVWTGLEPVPQYCGMTGRHANQLNYQTHFLKATPNNFYVSSF